MTSDFVSDMELPAYEHPPPWIPPSEVLFEVIIMPNTTIFGCSYF